MVESGSLPVLGMSYEKKGKLTSVIRICWNKIGQCKLKYLIQISHMINKKIIFGQRPLFSNIL